MWARSYIIIHLQREAKRLESFYPREYHKAMVHWAIRQIDPGLNDDAAFQIASRGGPGDAQIDAIWNHSNGHDLCVVQVKSSQILLSQTVENLTESDGEEELEVDKFDGEAVIDLKRALEKLIRPPPHPGDKLQRAIQLYQDAIRSRKNIEFYPIVYGDRYASYTDEMLSLRGLFNSDRSIYARHNVTPLDFTGLSELFDRNFEEPVGVVQISTNDWSFGPIETLPGLFIALVPAHTLSEIRESYDVAIYHSNFRFTLGNTPVRKGMNSTLQDDQEKKLFHLYHNGITILGHRISANHGQLTVHDLQVVNGLQTIETLYDFGRRQPGDDGPIRALRNVNVFVRFIDIDKQPTPGPDARTIEEKIAEYSNKQNPITNRDLRSNDAVQKRLQHEIDCLGYKYERKRGQYSSSRFRDLVSNEKLAQYALSFWIKEPADAKNKKKLLFVKDNENLDGFYDKIFFDNVPAAALLIPFEIKERVPPQRDGQGQLVVEHGDFVLLAMFGEIFMKRYRLNLIRTSNPRNREFLMQFHSAIRNGEIDTEMGRIWRELVSRLKNITQREFDRRMLIAHNEGKKEPTIRNILFNYNYSTHKHQLMPDSFIRRLCPRLPRF